MGAPLRYLTAHFLDGRLPWGTILVNVSGSFLLGLLSALALSGWAEALFATGFCGGFTTYSAFAVGTHDRGPRLGAVNVLVTVVPALLLCGLGFWLGSLA